MVARAAPAPGREPDDLACLEVATALYQQQLWATPGALQYLAQRGLADEILCDCRVGFASGSTLLAALRQRGISPDAARTVGLLRPDGREVMAGRIVVPEVQGGHPIWLIGRLLEPSRRRLKYLGLPGRKPLLGGDGTRSGATAILTEGVFDWLALRQWGYPALALLGTYASPSVLQELRRCSRLFLALDRDPPGQEATARLLEALGSCAIPVTLPPDVQDVADLGPRPDGRSRFARALAGVDQPIAA
jgi:DNA primase